MRQQGKVTAEAFLGSSVQQMRDSQLITAGDSPETTGVKSVKTPRNNAGQSRNGDSTRLQDQIPRSGVPYLISKFQVPGQVLGRPGCWGRVKHWPDRDLFEMMYCRNSVERG